MQSQKKVLHMRYCVKIRDCGVLIKINSKIKGTGHPYKKVGDILFFSGDRWRSLLNVDDPLVSM